MSEVNKVLPFVPRKKNISMNTNVREALKNPNYHPASIKLDKKIVEFLEIMTFEERNDFLNEVIDLFFEYVEGEENETK